MSERRNRLEDLNPHLPLAMALLGSVAIVMLVVSLALGANPFSGLGWMSTAAAVLGIAFTPLAWWLYFHPGRVPKDRGTSP